VRLSEKEKQVTVRSTGRGCGGPSTMPVIWLASFPKSGNTWMRFLLARLLFGPVASSAELECLIPDIHEPRMGPDAPPCRLHQGHLLLKTHWTFDVAEQQGRRTAGAIYLVRDPRDMLVSLFRYFRATTPAARDRLLTNFVETGGSTPEFVGFGFGNWRQHVESWLVAAPRRVPVLLVRYEDMLARPRAELRRLAEALGMEVEDGELDACIEDSRIDRLRAIEQRDARTGTGVFGRLARSKGEGFTFFPSGRAGSHRELLRRSELRLLEPLFEPWLTHLGYEAGSSAKADGTAVTSRTLADTAVGNPRPTPG